MHRLMMTIDGQVVPSSCVKVGSAGDCQSAAERLNRTADVRVGWIVLPCITN